MASKGDKFRAEADSVIQSLTSGFTGMFGFGKAQKNEEAADLYVKAGNAYKLENKWQAAGEAFVKAAKCHQDSESSLEAINDLVNAGNSFKKIDTTKAVSVFKKVIEKYNETGRFGQSAKYHQEIAEMYETDGKSEDAASHYNDAAQLYINENKALSAQPCFLKIASIHAKDGHFIQAADIFERIARDCLQSRLGAFSAKGYFFQSLICYLAAGDNVATRSKIDAFKSVDHQFPSSRECGFIEKLLEVSCLFVCWTISRGSTSKV